MKKLTILLLLIFLNGCGDFTNTSFYKKMSGDTIDKAASKLIAKDVTHTIRYTGVSDNNGVMTYRFSGKAKRSSHSEIILAYGDAIVAMLRKERLFVGAMNNPRYNKRDENPLEYSIIYSSDDLKGDIFLHLYRDLNDDIIILMAFREYPKN